ncbi:MAG TPA: hypothetical protein PLY62_01290 [Bacteroidales bacterium]|jgi:hypothetical protein|nr:hypothetical protein [Bacteroidales bacterium]HPB88750.1 hypothetical protein [Bacteroidales bacterium]HPH52681.1 hypothetical protein [Bacteroidales bacterium]HPY22415.1 hypothetical protein [Bacteroidales bacterium]HQN24386.1 hypothetical protein [Bacteroidales bacterium]
MIRTTLCNFAIVLQICIKWIKDLLLKKGNDETGIKSLGKVLNNRLTDKAVIYAGDFENDTAEIQLVNYKNMGRLF